VAKSEIPDGWTAQAYRFALDPSPARERAFRSHAGAARKAYNTMLALVKATMGQRQAERSHGIAEAGLTPALNWSLAGLRKEWNRRKDDAAPWRAENSKESCNTGLDALARGLDAWDKPGKGQRAGAAAGFPRFKSARSRRSARFTTGTIRVETDRHHITLPRVGRVRTHESTRKLARRIEAGTARILSATLTEEPSGRWFCSFQVIVQRTAAAPAHAGAGAAAVGVDAGVRAGSLLVIAAPDGRESGRILAPKSLTAAQARLRALQRKAARQQGPLGSGHEDQEAAVQALGQNEPAHRAHPRARRRRAPGRTAQGRHLPGAAPPGHHGGNAECLRDALGRRRPQARPEPCPRRRRAGRSAAHAQLQVHVVRLHARGSQPLFPVRQDLFGLRQAKAKPDPGRPGLCVRPLRPDDRP
jgi:hypothetical protein